ncbi:MAG: exodeoxyribonuclease VII small subunit [Elainella sp. Prado103]|nr:exodeoxyribonuclease VII small subunit [Elainella sp. Prado103]
MTNHSELTDSLPICSDLPSDQSPPDGLSRNHSQAAWSYEATVMQVEAIINQIERGDLELAEVFDRFAIAVEQLNQCEIFLTRQQQQVELLIETLVDEPEGS